MNHGDVLLEPQIQQFIEANLKRNISFARCSDRNSFGKRVAADITSEIEDSFIESVEAANVCERIDKLAETFIHAVKLYFVLGHVPLRTEKQVPLVKKSTHFQSLEARLMDAYLQNLEHIVLRLLVVLPLEEVRRYLIFPSLVLMAESSL